MRTRSVRNALQSRRVRDLVVRVVRRLVPVRRRRRDLGHRPRTHQPARTRQGPPALVRAVVRRGYVAVVVRPPPLPRAVVKPGVRRKRRVRRPFRRIF